jgi:hypothetical protein
MYNTFHKQQMNKPRIQIVKPSIFSYFDQLSSRVLKQSQISAILNEQRSIWSLGFNISTLGFIRFLMDEGRLQKQEFRFPKPYKKETRYTWGDVSLYEASLSLKPNGYFSHFTAIRLHDLTEQLPKTLYLNVEQANSSISSGTLTQASIDSALRRAPRTTKQVAEIEDYRLVILQGKNTGNLGVIAKRLAVDAGHFDVELRFTDLERTLIDVTVRPQYAGGVAEVLKAFELAKPKLSVARLANLLQKLDYIYPYHQAVGFYLTHAGYTAKAIAPIRNMPISFDFQLSHGLKKMRYIPEWRLRVPEGF